MATSDSQFFISCADDEAWEADFLPPDEISIPSGELEQMEDAEQRDDVAALASLKPEGSDALLLFPTCRCRLGQCRRSLHDIELCC